MVVQFGLVRKNSPIVRLGSSLSAAPNIIDPVPGEYPRISAGIGVEYRKSGCLEHGH